MFGSFENENVLNQIEHFEKIGFELGANEVVSLLLEKGAAIDTLNAEKKNCLDIAIERDKKEVIKVYFFLIIDSFSVTRLFKNNFLKKFISIG